MGSFLDKPGVTCPVCKVDFPDKMHMLINTVHYQHCDYRERVTYSELWEYLYIIKKEEYSDRTSQSYMKLPIIFDTLLIPTTKLKYEPLRFAERDNVQLFIEKASKNTDIKFSLRCIRCKKSHFRKKSCIFTTDVCNLEKTMEDIFFEIRGKKIPPCVCIRKSSKIEDDSTCIFCMEEVANAYFAPCQHIPYCVSCAKKCMKKYNTCPICRSIIMTMIVL